MTCDELREWLMEKGFSISTNTLRERPDWYAWRKIDRPLRECETNKAKSMKLVVYPYELHHNGQVFHSAECEVCGERNSVWYKLRAYGTGINGLMENLDSIEASLANAWEAL